jgi:hypothetical protein
MQITWVLASCDKYSTYLMEQSPFESFWEVNRFSRGQKNYRYFVKSKSKLPHLQVLIICLYFKPHQCNPCPQPTSWRSILMLSCYPGLDFPRDLISSVSPPKSCMDISSPHTCYIFLLSISPDLITAIIFREVTDQSVLNYLVSPLHWYLVPFRLKYSPQHSILRRPQSTFLPQFELPSSRPIQEKRQNDSYLSFFLYFWITSFTGLNRQWPFSYMTFTMIYSGILVLKVQLGAPTLPDEIFYWRDCFLNCAFS